MLSITGKNALSTAYALSWLMRVPYIVVIGEQEAESGTVTPRSREDGDLGTMKLEEFAERLVAESKVPRLTDKQQPTGA